MKREAVGWAFVLIAILDAVFMVAMFPMLFWMDAPEMAAPVLTDTIGGAALFILSAGIAVFCFRKAK